MKKQIILKNINDSQEYLYIILRETKQSADILQDN